jgi:hypothetical protein
MTRSKQETIPRPFRFQAETLAQLDALCAYHNGMTRTDVLRLLVSRAYRAAYGKNATLPDPPPMPKGRRPSAESEAKSANRRKHRR